MLLSFNLWLSSGVLVYVSSILPRYIINNNNILIFLFSENIKEKSRDVNITIYLSKTMLYIIKLTSFRGSRRSLKC